MKSKKILGALFLSAILSGCSGLTPEKPIDNQEENNNQNNDDNTITYGPKCYFDNSLSMYISEDKGIEQGNHYFKIKGFDNRFYYNESGNVYDEENSNRPIISYTNNLYTDDVNNDGFDDFIYVHNTNSGTILMTISVLDYKNNMMYNFRPSTRNDSDYFLNIVNNELVIMQLDARTLYWSQAIQDVGKFVVENGEISILLSNYDYISGFNASFKYANEQGNQITLVEDSNKYKASVYKNSVVYVDVTVDTDKPEKLLENNIVVFSTKTKNNSEYYTTNKVGFSGRFGNVYKYYYPIDSKESFDLVLSIGNKTIEYEFDILENEQKTLLGVSSGFNKTITADDLEKVEREQII